MKRIKTFLLLIISVILTGCNTSNRGGFAYSGEKYYLEVTNPYPVSSDSVVREAPTSGYYYAGTILTLKIERVYDWGVDPYFNDKFVLEEDITGDNYGPYKIYKIEMPAHDSTLVLSSTRFYKDREYDFSEVFYEIPFIKEDKITSVEIETVYSLDTPKYTSSGTVIWTESEIISSDDQNDIDFNLGLLNKKLVNAKESDLPQNEEIKTFRFCSNESTYSIHFCENIVYLMNFSGPEPFKIVDCEEGFSIKNIKETIRLS